MRIVAIDASALRGGSVSAAVETAAVAAETAGGSVERFRVYSISALDRGQSPHPAATRGLEETIAVMVDAILDSDGVILGTPSTHAGLNAGTRALLKRLAACFAGHCFERGYHGRPTRLSPGRRVGLLTSSSALPALALAHAATLGPTIRVQRTFARGGVKLFGQVAIADVPGYPLARDRAMARAAELGSGLVASIRESEVTLPASWERVPLATRHAAV